LSIIPKHFTQKTRKKTAWLPYPPLCSGMSGTAAGAENKKGRRQRTASRRRQRFLWAFVPLQTRFSGGYRILRPPVGPSFRAAHPFFSK